MIEIALHYAAQGWPVFPLIPRDKYPLKGSHGYKDATTSPALIETWWRREPKANIGLATGRASGLLVLDVDVKNDKPGIASMRTLSLPRTFTVRTPTGGFHLYFDMPAASISIGADLLPGVDWRGNGGYVVAAGSATADGMYEIMDRAAIATLPERVVHLLREAKRRAPIQRSAAGAVIPEGARDDTLIRIAGAIRRFGVEAPAILECLRAVSRHHCQPPHEERDLERLAASAARYPAGGRKAS